MNAVTQARQRFLKEYRHIRRAEGRGSDSADYYQALPFRDLSGRSPAMWRMRAQTYSWFERKVLLPLERRKAGPLDVLDLGAGNCWLSNRLCLRGHRPVAVDIFPDNRDGLGAARHYEHRFPTIEADFDYLPLPSRSFDLVVFNASLHYSTDYVRTLSEARLCLRPSGLVVVLDSPIYRQSEHGIRMVKEKHTRFLQEYGFRSDALPSLEFLDFGTIRFLRQALAIRWQIFKPWYGWRWHLRPLQAWLRKRRPPSRFWILVGRFQSL